MQNLEGLMVETGRVIQRRYLLQRLVKQGRACTVYQGFDQVLQRVVAIKVTPADYVATYRAALRLTSQFSHPNIVGIYDLIVEPDCLYIVQEYVDGDDFPALLQTQLSAFEVADLGRQICLALVYASNSGRKICHGDLTPSSVIRDRRGLVRVSNFALPADMQYFTLWSGVGGDGIAISDQQLPYGQISEGRLADDARAAGLLLYQLLTSRAPGATFVEPPSDGRLRFQRGVPPELCDIVARAVIRQHPQRLMTPEMMYLELKDLAEALEPLEPVQSSYQTEDMVKPRQIMPVASGAPGGLPSQERAPTGLLSYHPEATVSGLLDRQEVSQPLLDPAATTEAAYQQATAMNSSPGYPPVEQNYARGNEAAPVDAGRGVNWPLMIGLGLVLFALFFFIGFFLSQAVFHA
ncbi:protein kinase domain-containing protein [Thermosporothrix hazakensis]|jgi:serine/threonine protein kinase|nr:protein kinase [Thermosporothrix hazakensis]GCE48131.1 hypothetical protein KTH_30000 [Thermosporothrix hazakensis]